MKRILIVSPHFPPINAPDHQRVRMALPYLHENGWDACVLAVRPEDVQGVEDPFLLATLPEDIEVSRVRALRVSSTALFGVRSLAIRSLLALKNGGEALLHRRRFDLVFISTTLFPVMALGPLWKHFYRIPYVLDFQDPWVNDYDHQLKGQRPPGGRFKYGLSQQLARTLEPLCLRRADHLVSVSPDYPDQWRRRYPWAADIPSSVLPFGAPERDFERLPVLPVKIRLDPQHQHWAYVGRGGDDMAPALRAFFLAFKQARTQAPQHFDRVRLHFLGTDYAPAGRGRETVLPIAREFGVEDVVRESTARLPYGEALAWLQAADALIVPGSDDPSYTASKIYPYVLARKPLLAIFHERSSVVTFLDKTRAGTVVPFASNEPYERVAERVSNAWFNTPSRKAPAVDWEAFAPYTARSMTQRLCALFEQACRRGGVR